MNKEWLLITIAWCIGALWFYIVCIAQAIYGFPIFATYGYGGCVIYLLCIANAIAYTVKVKRAIKNIKKV